MNGAGEVVRECAAARDAKLEDYTIDHAIDDARWLRGQHDGFVSGDRAKQVIETLLSALERSPTYLKALQNGEEVFVLRERDRAAPDAISHWAYIAKGHGTSAEKITDAYRTASQWRAQPPELTRWPD